MGLLSWLFGGKTPTPGPAPSGKPPEHAVILHILLEREMPDPVEMERYHDLQDELEKAIHAAHAGELDGDEWGEGMCVIYMYGPDAEALWEAVAPVLEKHQFPAGSHAVKRTGPPGSPQETIRMEWQG